MNTRPTIAITLGDPGGIGPEVIVKALADDALRTRATFHIYGVEGPLKLAAQAIGVKPFWARSSLGLEAPPRGASVVLIDLKPDNETSTADLPWPPRENAGAGTLSFQAVEEAIAASKLPAGHPWKANAIVTGPINKAAWALAGHSQYPGHTELLADRFGIAEEGHGAVMMFESPKLRVALVTTHVPLREVSARMSSERIAHVIRLAHRACIAAGIKHPRIAVCGLNPHAGEHGLLGHEDDAIIAPAINAARNEGIEASGPWPGDTVFLKAVGETRDVRQFDLVVAMYHDQGLIPVKLLDRDRAVNLTLGLPVPRTSPDHGTAFDIVGQGRADPGSMNAAIESAIRLASVSLDAEP